MKTMLVIQTSGTGSAHRDASFNGLELMDIEYDTTSVSDALRQAKRRAYDIILFKIHGSDDSSIEILKALRQSYPKLPLLFLSMQRQNRNIVQILRSGADGYIQKEVMATELANAITYLLQGHKYVS